MCFEDKWHDIDTAPKDGTPILVLEEQPYRYLPYKPDGRRQMRALGRWQSMTEYGGWENCAEPVGKWRAPDQEEPADGK